MTDPRILADAFPDRTTPPLPPYTDRILKLAEIIGEVADKHGLDHQKLAAGILGILAHPGFSGCHDGPAAPPAQGAPPAPQAPEAGEVAVPVSERLPGEGDCDAEGRCWWCDGDWHLKQVRYRGAFDTHWLPSHAIPLPQAGEAGA